MSLYRDEAVVLRTQKLGEADRIITLLTREHGRVRGVAKGVRRTKSKFGARAFFKNINPFFPILDSWSRVMVHNEILDWSEVGKGAIWAFGTFAIGTYLFLSREREFAVRV